MEKINICLSTDDNYAKYAATAMLSILDNKNPEDEIIFHILYSNLNDKNIEQLLDIENVVMHRVENALFEPFFNKGVCKGITIPTLYRLKIPSLLPNVKRILYLDCDLIVLKSLAPLYHTKLNENQIAAAVADYAQEAHFERMNFKKTNENFYFNAGVCLLDLEKMRNNNIEEKMFNYLQENWQHISYCDQDIMNAILLGQVKQMPQEYNFITPNFYFETQRDIAIAHFAGVKPWKIGFYNKFREIFWEYLLKTEFLDEKEGKKAYNKIHLWHKKFFQVLLILKMYPAFFLKKSHREDFIKIFTNKNY